MSKNDAFERYHAAVAATQAARQELLAALRQVANEVAQMLTGAISKAKGEA